MTTKKPRHWWEKASEVRKQKGIKLGQLAKAAGVEVSTVSHWLKGRREPSVPNMRILARELGMSFGEMVEEDPYYLHKQDERQLMDKFRDLPEEKKDAILRILGVEPQKPEK